MRSKSWVRRVAWPAVAVASLGACHGGEEDTGTGERADAADYLDLTLQEQVAAVESGEIDCPALVDAYLVRIAERDEGPEGIHAFLSLEADPVGQAAGLDATLGSGLPLQCAVVGVKDNIDLAGLATTAGSLALEGNIARTDATLVARLRDQGALPVGKTNLSEWANFRGYYSTSGWSSLGGQTLNGADPAYNPCGSSSGSAAAVAAGIVPVAIGTETDGSIVCPAAVNGVVGFKPTVGLVSRAGLVPISHTQDTAGPIARTVAEAARLLAAMAGPDPLDPATDRIPEGLDTDFEAQLEGDPLAGVRLGVVENLVGADDDLELVFGAAVERLEGAGATVVTVPRSTAGSYGADELTVLLFEFKEGVNDYLAAHPQPGQPATLAELIAFNDAHAEEVMPHFGQEIFRRAEGTTGLEAPAYLTALERAAERTGEGGILAVMGEHDLDALIAPTMGTAWVTNYATGDTYSGRMAAGPAAVAGYPHVTVPMGEVDGLPVGLSVFAGAWQDAQVLAIAHAFEQLSR